MRKVTEKEFYEFLKNKEFYLIYGRFVMSTTYVDSNTIGIIAVKYSGIKTTYEIKAIT